MSSPAPMDEDSVPEQQQQQLSAASYDQVFVPPAQAESEASSDEGESAPQAEPAPATASPSPAAEASAAASDGAATPPPAAGSPQIAAGSATQQDDEDVRMASADEGDDDAGERASTASAHDGGAGDGDDFDGGAGADEAGGSMSFKKGGKRGDGSADKSEGHKKKKRRKASPSPEREEGSPVPMPTEDDIRKAALNRRIDEIIKKPSNRRKRNKDGDDDLDQYADDMIQTLKDRMLDAADKDEQLGKEGRDATAKESMLNDVVDVLQQQTLLQSIVDNDLLSAVRRWLEPLPDRTLPSLGIQTAFFEILVKMDIDTPTLKSCGLGKIVIFYTKSRRSTLRVRRLAERLQLAWLRPLVKKSSAYRTKVVEQVDVKERKPLPRFKTLEKERERSKRDESLTPGGERSEIKAQSIGNKRRGARIPMSSSLSFTVAPRYDSQQPSQSSQSGGGAANKQEEDQMKRQREAERLRKVKARLAEARRAEKS